MNFKIDHSTIKNLKKNKPDYLYKNLNNNSFESQINFDFDLKGGLRTKGFYKSSDLDKPLISIITVSLNSEKTIEKTIQSVLNQTYDNVEFIIIDGKSSDQTLEIIKKYENSIDFWISEKDTGIYNAMNKGLKICSGDIIGILNSDDEYTKDALELVKIYFEKEVDFVFGSVEKDRLLSGLNKEKIYWKFNIYPAHSSGFFISKSAQIKVGLYDEEFKLHADYDLIYKLIVKLKLNGIAMERNHITGKFNYLGISSQEKQINYFFEEFRIRKKNKQNLFYIFILFIIKNIYFYLLKIDFLNKAIKLIKQKFRINY